MRNFGGEAHPDRKREYQQRWVEENLEKVREFYNRYYETHRDEARMHEFADAYVYVVTHERMGLPPVPVENIVYARAVEIVAERMRRMDLLTSRGVAAAAWSAQAEVRYEERQR
ncbi:hypothetical protein [Cryobacterium sp. Hz9]|uniref:hypothetical protein n=1 Tax=Cryobacterium sp. Hz9 TaxID=1259167 RepID=UPI00106D376E|nr:hypothetical protein [Cryobacterium sp. Hz9]TFB71498.1 hypothetical protein E3N85_00565 [Cryobacterium sp. Hz9]